MTVLLALASALTFGASDFAGGLAARRGPVLAVTILAQAAGFLILIPALLVLPGALSTSALLAGALAGVAGAGGLVLYLRALAIGPMGVASPLAGVTGAALPVGFGIVAGERPSILASVGIVLGLLAVVLATGGDRSAARAPVASRVASATRVAIMSRVVAGSRRGPVLALFGGLGFGVFFVALDASPEGSGLWPLAGARVSALVLLLVIASVLRRSWRPGARDAAWLAVATGVLDMIANSLFLASTRAGLLSLAALISSLYPVVVAALAHGLLRERLDRLQWIGVAACVSAVALIALG